MRSWERIDGHDRTAIVAHQLAVIVALISPQRSNDRASIVVLGYLPSTIRWRSTHPGESTWSAGVARPMEIGPSWCVHAVLRDCRNRERSRPSDETTSDEAMIKLRRRSESLGASTCHHVSPLIVATYSGFCARALINDRVDSGPRDLHRPDWIRRLRCRHVTCTEETCGNIVPHGRKKWKSSV